MQSTIIKDTNILGGEPVFRGTRVPFKILIEYLEGGETLDQFLEQYPSAREDIQKNPGNFLVPVKGSTWSASVVGKTSTPNSD